MGPLNDVVVTTTRTRRHGCHNDVVAVEPRPPFSTIRLTGSGIGLQLAGTYRNIAPARALRNVPCGSIVPLSRRILPPKAPFTDCQSHRPGLLLAGTVADGRPWQTYTDPQSGQQFPVWEGHYTYPGTDLKFIPTYSGGMFEA